MVLLETTVQCRALRDCSSISFIMMTVLPFECNETASRGGGGGLGWSSFPCAL